MTKLYRVVAYVLNLNDDSGTKEDVIRNITSNRHPEFIKIEDIQETDCGEWDDDHELNKRGCNYDKYFPDIDGGPLDEHLKNEYRRVRGLMLQYIENVSRLERENAKLKKQNDSLTKVKEFVRKVKDLAND